MRSFMPNRWPFADAESLAVLSLTRIVSDNSNVLYAKHDWDGSWQFLDGEDCTTDDAVILGLSEIIAIDPTLCELAALPIGFFAFRDTINAPWQVEYSGEEEEEEEEE